MVRRFAPKRPYFFLPRFVKISVIFLWGFFSCSRPKACKKQVKQIYDTGKKKLPDLCWYLVPGSYEYEMWSFEGFGQFIRYIGQTGSQESRRVRQVTPKPNHPMCSTRTSASLFPKANFLGVAHSGWCRCKRRGIDVRERGGTITSLPYSQSNSHHRYQLLEPLHGAGFSTVPLQDTIPMGARVAACDLQAQFHGVDRGRAMEYSWHS